MNSKERVLLDTIKSYQLIAKDAERLESQLESACYGVTASYRMDGGSSGGFSSKVENFAIRNMENKRMLEGKLSLLHKVDDALANSGLKKREYELIKHVMSGNSLSSFARQRNIYKSSVYKIRDNALRKMVNRIETRQNERKSMVKG